MSKEVLQKENVKLKETIATKEEAIKKTGNILVEQGYVDSSYIDSMLEREKITSTYMGNFVAIPHGTEDSKALIQESGISIIQVPDGVDFGDGRIVKILIGIAGKGDEHLEILSKIAIVCSEEENIQKMIDAGSAEELLDQFSEVN
ncbi:PTS sugar transporter subunit IIA [Alteribacillus sp. HJP-4]|uniref:PTS sugar transporter subunit IIA n=1 Tax=Alteribacillus sp. HJP-4 TaxID=2775394 RepID=UPI0035CCFA2D